MAKSYELKEIEDILKDTKALCLEDNGMLWGRTLDVPILLIDKENGRIYSNKNSKKLGLNPYNEIYTGILPNFVDVIKGPAKIGNQIWAVIPLPLPEDKIEKQCIILHEAFHCVQPEMDLKPEPYNNNHMDEMEARFWLKLEWKALELALQSEGENKKQAITDALCFRHYRRALFGKCDGCENRFEIHEGMAEYTAQKLCRNDKDLKIYLQNKLHSMWESPSFVNCFAYFSGPVYAYLLDKTETNWRTHLGARDDIAAIVQSTYEISLPFDIYMEAEERSVLYSGAQIMGEELDRELAL
ncbi:hypothetical protein [Labilibaculum sp.]|uniref:hypothetical protein n=1 Tax=Labilibaculum sp. TaxID=2060723 RepID=UPI002AA95840|nr:hypothetical protein [Labilibaculum sp.]MBN2598668.1 hypothetical protein [Marinifilaceae bacterium]